jgi:uncharacterized protein (DUF433 family)
MNIEDLIERDSVKMGRTPVFANTSVPIKHLFDYLESGDSLETFLSDFPIVSREQAIAVLKASRESVLNYSDTDRARLDLMRKALRDELFLADLNETMSDFGLADQEINDILTVERMAREP